MKVFTKCDYCQEKIELEASKMKKLNFCCYGCEVRYKKEHKPIKIKQEYIKKPKPINKPVTKYKEYIERALKQKEVDSAYKTFKKYGRKRWYGTV